MVCCNHILQVSMETEGQQFVGLAARLTRARDVFGLVALIDTWVIIPYVSFGHATRMADLLNMVACHGLTEPPFLERFMDALLSYTAADGSRFQALRLPFTTRLRWQGAWFGIEYMLPPSLCRALDDVVVARSRWSPERRCWIAGVVCLSTPK